MLELYSSRNSAGTSGLKAHKKNWSWRENIQYWDKYEHEPPEENEILEEILELCPTFWDLYLTNYTSFQSYPCNYADVLLYKLYLESQLNWIIKPTERHDLK